jgi:hypothetical protein
MVRILIIDDDQHMNNALSRVIKKSWDMTSHRVSCWMTA